MVLMYGLLFGQQTKHPSKKNRNARKNYSRAPRATYDFANYSTSAAAIDDITCRQDLPIPRTIIFKPPGPSFSYTVKGRNKKRSKDLHKQFTLKPSRKVRKVNHPDPDAIATRTRSKTEKVPESAPEPVSSRTRSKSNAPPISTRTAGEPKRAVPHPTKQELFIEIEVQVEIGEGAARPRSQKLTRQRERSDPYDDLERHNNEVEMWAERIGRIRLQIEADKIEQERLERKKKEEHERQRQKEKEEQEKKSKEVIVRWNKIIKWNKGAEEELRKKDRMDELREWTREQRLDYEPATFTYGDQGRRIPKKFGTRTRARAEPQARKKKKKGRIQDNQTPQRARPGLSDWLITSLLFWYYWKYRTIFGLCLFLWAFISDLLWECGF